MPQAQEDFILATRRSIDASNCDALFVDWMDIRPMVRRYGPRVRAPNTATYCTRRVAMWVPDLLFGEQPYCPDCAGNSAVSANKHPKWVRGGPMRVFGRYSSYYLDTKHYHCAKCNIWFKATNPASVKLATMDIITGFRLFLSSRYAVDLELRHYIVQHFTRMPLAKMAKELEQAYYFSYYEQVGAYAAACMWAKRHDCEARPVSSTSSSPPSRARAPCCRRRCRRRRRYCLPRCQLLPRPARSASSRSAPPPRFVHHLFRLLVRPDRATRWVPDGHQPGGARRCRQT